MINLIAFYLLFVIYKTIVIIYLVKQVKKFRLTKEFSKEKLESEFIYVVRNIFYITSLTLLICSYVLFGVKAKEPLDPAHIGLVLAIGTFVFYVVFLVWDILKVKVKDYFIDKHNVEIDKKTLFGGIHIITMVFYALLLIEATVSIIEMIIL